MQKRKIYEKYTEAQCKDISVLRIGLIKALSDICAETDLTLEQCMYGFVGAYCMLLENAIEDKDLEEARMNLDGFKSGVLGFLGEMRGFK